MKRKTLGILLALCMLFGVLLITSASAASVSECEHPIADGETMCSGCDAIIIRTAEDLLVLMHSDNVDSSDEVALAAAREALNKSYVLANDIDLSTYDYTAEGNYTSQSPIGTKNDRWDYDVLAFTGIFDGNGKTVSGVNINSSENHVGFFGGTMNGAVIEDLTVEGTIKGGNYTGGIVGWNRDTLTISNCTSKVTVIGGADVGGIVGYAETVSANHSVLLDSCVNEGALSGSGRVGGMIGRLWQNASSGTAKIADCVNNATVTTSGGQAAGMLAWWTASSGTAQSLTIGDCTNTGAATGGNGATAGIFGFGQIQAATALTIENCDNLADDVNDKIQDAAYAGGILARVDKNAPLSLTVSDCTNTMNVSSNHRAAGIVGYHNVPSGSKTEIKMCSNSGAIAGATKVGGIVGELYALYGATTAVTKCMNFGAVTTTGTGDNYAAGIVAYYNAQSNAVSALSECMNSGTITSAAYAAGIIGMRNGGTTVTDAWNSGSVSGTKAGGIIGNSGQAALVSHVFNSNVNVMQAIIGNNATAPNVEDAYYIAGGTVSNSNAGVAYDASIHFDMLNANGKWVEIAGKPELKDLHVHDFVNNTTFKDNGDGTHTVSCACGTPQTGASASLHDYGDSGICACGAFMPIEEITTAKELMILMNASSLWTDGSYTLGNDIDLSAYTGSLRQQPIGNATIAFKGVFDGKGHTISGLELSGVGSIALFGKAENAEIKNLTVEGSITSTKNYAAGIVAEARDRVTISNCTNKATVIGDADVGGIVGYAETGSADHSILIDSCVNEGALRGSGRVGGMIGRLWQNASSGTAKISACVNKATVTTAGGQAAGMLAWWTVSNGTAQSVTIRDCTNTGAATGGNGATAGIFGFGQIQTAAALTIQNCDNLADDVNDKVQDNSYAAGIAGRFDMDAPLSLTASDCTNTMSVSGATISGIVSRILFKTDAAANSVLKFDNCVNTLSDVSGYTSTITATGFSGGILGFIENTKASGFDLDVLNCRNDMEIAGGKQVGGIIASNYIRAAGNSYVYNCTNTGNIKLNTGSEGVGGILGYYYIDSDTVATVEACTNTGKVTGAGHAGGIVGYHNAPAGSTTTFTKCLNSGEITATANAYAAGIVANYFVSSGTASALSECMNSGSISSKGFAGGIIGMRNGTTTVTDVLNTGSVTAVQVSGGIIGHSGETALVSHAFNSSTAVAQAIIGVPATAPNIADAYYIAANTVSNTNGGVVYDASTLFDALNANGKWVKTAEPMLACFHEHSYDDGVSVPEEPETTLYTCSACGHVLRLPEDAVVTVYVDGTGNTVGAYSDFAEAVESIAACGGTIVVCGDTTVSGTINILANAIEITSEKDAVLTIGDDLSIVKGADSASITFDLPVKASGTKIFGGFANVTFAENFTVDGELDFYGGVDATALTVNEDAVTETAYAVTVKNGTFHNFAAGNYRSEYDDTVGALAAPVSVTVEGGVFNDSFSVSGMSILADDATLSIRGGTFNCPVYVQGTMRAVNSTGARFSGTVASDRKYYAIDGDITVDISGGTFNGGMIGAYEAQVAYTQVMRGDYTVTVSGGSFADGTVFDATQVKAYAGESKKASIVYPDTYAFDVVRFDNVKDAKDVPYTEPLRIAFVGDSITEGFAPASLGLDRLYESYPAVLASIAADNEVEMIASNYGVSAAGILKATTYYYPDYLAYDLLTEETDADYIVVAIGTNDFAAGGTTGVQNTFVANYRDFIETLGELPATKKVFITNAIVRNDAGNARIRMASAVRPLQEQIAKEFEAQDSSKYTFVDFFRLTLADAAAGNLLSADKLHPSKGGYEIMADVLYGVIFEDEAATTAAYKSNDVYVSASGSEFASGTKDDPISRLDLAFAMLPAGEESTVHIIGKVSYNGSILIPVTPSKLTIVGEGSGAILENGDISFKIGCDVKFDNITLATTASTGMYGCYYDVEMTDTVYLTGDWSFFAGYNVYTEGETNVAHDSVASASAAWDCNIILLANGTINNFALGNRRFQGSSPFGTYSGNLTAYIGENITISGTDCVGIVGQNYLTGTISVDMPETLTLATYAPTFSVIFPIVYDSAKNTGTVSIKTAVVGDVNGDGSVTLVDALLVIKAVLNDTVLENADMNGDGKISLLDAIRVLKRISAN